MHFSCRTAMTLPSVAISFLIISTSGGAANVVPPVPTISFTGPISCIVVGQSALYPPLTVSATGTSRIASIGQLAGCLGNVTQHDWTITGGIVIPLGLTPSILGNCNGIGGPAIKSTIYWQATPLAGAVVADFPPPTKIGLPAPIVTDIGGNYVETWPSNITATGSFHTSSGSQTLTVSPSVTDLTSECTTPANAPSGISYLTTGGTISF
jgi:hypothetical protein